VDARTGAVTALAVGRARIVASVGMQAGAYDINVVPRPSRLTVSGMASGGTGTIRSTPAGIDCRIIAGMAQGSCAADFPGDVRVVLTALTDVGSLPGAWAGACTGATSTCEADADQPRTAVVGFTALRQVTVSLGNDGDGAVTSSPQGIDCRVAGATVSGTCSAMFRDSTIVTLAAVPNALNTPLAWSGACSGAVAGGTCSLSLAGTNASISTQFAPPATATIGISGSGGGQVGVSANGAPATTCTLSNAVLVGTCAPPFAIGTTVTVSAQPDSASTFAGWTGACAGTATTCRATITPGGSIGAVFTRRQVPLTLMLSGAGAGRIDVGSAGSCSIVAGQGSTSCTLNVDLYSFVSLGASAAPNAQFGGWAGPCTGVVASCAVTATGPISVGATFVPGLVPLSVTSGAGTATGAVVSVPAGITCTIGTTTTSGSCVAAFASGASVTLYASPTTGAVFAGWGGSCASFGNAPVCTVTLAAASAASTRFNKQPVAPLTVSGAGTGSGAVTGAPGAINCAIALAAASGACSASVPLGTVVTLKATPNGTSLFAGWSGACTGTAPTCQVTVDQVRAVTATFDAPAVPMVTYTLMLSGSGGGHVTVGGVTCTLTAGQGSTTCTAQLPANAPVALTATPATGSTFWTWAGACAAFEVAPTCTITPTAAATIGAVFLPAPVSLGVQAAAGSLASGTVISAPSGVACTLTGASASGTCSASFPLDGLVQLDAAPAIGAFFAGWGGACAFAGTAPTCSITLTAPASVTARFDVARLGLTVGGAGAGGGMVSSAPAGVACSLLAGAPTASGACAASYAFGTVVTLTAAPNASSAFAGWSGACSGVTPTCIVTMDQVRAATATFVPLPPPNVTLTATLSGAGAGSVSVNGAPCTLTAGQGATTCGFSVPPNAPATLVATAGASATFAGWAGACAAAGTATTCTVTPSANVTVGAVFVPTPVTLAVQAGAGSTASGTVTSVPGGLTCSINAATTSGACSAPFAVGGSVTLSATAGTGAVFGGWGGACAASGSTPTCTIAMTAAASVSARFDSTQLALTVTAASSGGGSVTSAPPAIACTIASGAPQAGSTCSASFPYGTVATLTAAPNGSSTFAGWAGACSGTTTTCNVTMDQARAVTVTFAPAQVTATVALSGTGGGTVTANGTTCTLATAQGSAACQLQAAIGTTVTFAASAAAGSTFGGWSGACAAAGTALTCTVTLAASTTIGATFTVPTSGTVSVAVQVIAGSLGSGTVVGTAAGISCSVSPATLSGTCAVNLAPGTSVTLLATPNTSSLFGTWGGACAASHERMCVFTATSNSVASVRFNPR
jgi:hypothetical protein